MAHLMIHFFILSAACSFPRQTAVTDDPTSTISREFRCEPSEQSLSADATLSDRAGRYRIMLVPDSTGTAHRVVSGLLTLRLQLQESDSTQESDPTQESDSTSDPSAPLYGFTDIDPEAVGAHRVGDPGSRDPSAPGVLVLEREEYGRRVITLRLGSNANRRDVVRYDGPYTVLRVRKSDEDGFAGSWRSGSGSGLDLSVTTGHFCAWKIP